jgi:hypothetical protein
MVLGCWLAGSGLESLGQSSLPTDPNELVLAAVRNAVWGPSFHCKMRQTSWIRSDAQTIQGECWQAGQGSGKVRLDLRLREGDPYPLQQVCDGRVLWTAAGEDKPLRTVDLDRVRYDLGVMGRRPSHIPEIDLYLAIGGPSEVLRMLYLRYRWYRVKEMQMDGVPVWQLIGTLRTGPPAITTSTTIDSDSLDPNPSERIPSDVRLTLSRDVSSSWFPFRIEYFKRAVDRNGKIGNQRFSTVEYYDLRLPWAVADDVFAIKPPEKVGQKEDETARYSPTKPLAGAARPARR